MKVLILAYARKNIGDDLFIKMLLDRYPTVDFFIKANTKEYFTWFTDTYKNLTVLIGADTDVELNNSNVTDYDAYIYVGGSIFMEGGKVYNLSEDFYSFMQRCKENNIPFMYVSSNYGPYQTQEYFDLSIKNFKECTDICFRDKYSYNLFKDIPSVRYAPDYVFTYDLGTFEKINNSVGISVIDLDIRNKLKDKSEKYLNFLEKNISNYIDQGKTVYLYSFCEYEGDEKTIDYLLGKFPEGKVIPVRYNGDLNTYLEMYSKMEYMICARFHAMILSLIANQKIYVVSYSKKIDNVIDDLELNLPIIHFEDIEENINLDLDDFVLVDTKKINKISKEAEQQELAVKKYLK
ncbi:MAG: polysaccharide pyruvyl transferase family protein [Clostridia bacterium]|nr:polysaccharide pyruvyl transferase family protein [Clostridia bacterium]